MPSTLYLDEDCAPDLQSALALVGLSVTSVRLLGHLGWKDDQHLLYAQQHGYVFMTHNVKDFELLHDAWVLWRSAPGFVIPPHAGILILRRANPVTLAQIIDAFLAGEPMLADSAYSWEPGDGWARRANHAWLPYQ